MSNNDRDIMRIIITMIMIMIIIVTIIILIRSHKYHGLTQLKYTKSFNICPKGFYVLTFVRGYAHTYPLKCNSLLIILLIETSSFVRPELVSSTNSGQASNGQMS